MLKNSSKIENKEIDYLESFTSLEHPANTRYGSGRYGDAY